MKKILSILLVAMFAMATMSFGPPVTDYKKDYFTITNTKTGGTTDVSVDKFTTWVDGNPSYTVNLDGGIYKGELIEINYRCPNFFGTPYLTWFYGWDANNAGSFASLAYKGTGLTQTFSTDNNISSNASTLIVKCNYKTDEQSSATKTYIMYIKVINGNRITVKNSNASEVQVTYENYEEVSSVGKRATVALYDIYGNPVSTGYLDNLGMSTLSTKGKPGIYIVKVTMNNQVIFNQRIQVK